MAIELRMHRVQTLDVNGLPFFVDVDITTAKASSLALARERWDELGQPEQLIVILADVHHDDRTNTAEIPIVTGESEVISDVRVADPQYPQRPTPYASFG